MIRHDVKQGSREWEVLRLGIPTASRFDSIMTPGGKPSSSASKYVAELCSEWLLGYSLERANTEWMERGSEVEAQAIAAYEFEIGEDVDRVGFVTRDDGLVGGSPDGFVGDDGGVEIKCPKIEIHVGYLIDGGLSHVGQCQGLMYLTGRKWWDVVSFNPMFPPAIFRVPRNEAYIANLEVNLGRFLVQLESAKEKLQHLKGRV